MPADLQPVIVLAFANDREYDAHYLRNLPAETRQLRTLLEQAERDGRCKPVVRANTTIPELFDVFQDQRGRIAIFHFGGHANSYQLLLETATGAPAVVDAGGLAAFLAQQRGLRLVFLNGCATQAQVQGLHAAGIPVVIATNRAIADDMATAFAARFYRALVSDGTIRTAFNEAAAEFQAKLGDNTRNLYAFDPPAEGDEAWPWVCHVRPGAEDAADWQLPAAGTFGPAAKVPLERPARAEHFQDRQAELKTLLAELQPGRVVTLCGPGGIGKSALAAEAVWQLAPGSQPAPGFPDGIIFHSFYNRPQADLALEHIARSFGEEVRPTPKEAAQRALAGRRGLLLLDGTELADDLRAVLEVCDQWGVLVTSRQRKDAVAARQDVAPLPPDDAVQLLQAWGGRRAVDTAAVRQISQLVGRLPLALRLVGRYLSEHEENAADYLAWLQTTPLAALDQGQRQRDSVPLLLARSLAQVSEQARQVMGVVGLLALAPFTWEPITIALDILGSETRRSLGELVSYGLLLRPDENYEVTHALVHTYARLQLAPAVPVVAGLAAYYTAFVAEHRGNWVELQRVRQHAVTLIQTCIERKAWTAANDLAWAMEDYLDLQGYWTDRIAIISAGLVAVRALQDRRGEGNHLGNLGNAYHNLGQVPQAIASYQQALAISREIGDRRGEGADLGNLGNAYRNLGQVPQAIAYHQQALAISREIGDRSGEGAALGNLGNAYRNLGQVPQAIAYYQQALAISREIGDRRGEGNHLGNLGLAYAALGQVPQAIEYYQQALAIFEEIKSPNAGLVREWLEKLKAT